MGGGWSGPSLIQQPVHAPGQNSSVSNVSHVVTSALYVQYSHVCPRQLLPHSTGTVGEGGGKGTLQSERPLFDCRLILSIDTHVSIAIEYSAGVEDVNR